MSHIDKARIIFTMDLVHFRYQDIELPDHFAIPNGAEEDSAAVAAQSASRSNIVDVEFDFDASDMWQECRPTTGTVTLSSRYI